MKTRIRFAALLLGLAGCSEGRPEGPPASAEPSGAGAELTRYQAQFLELFDTVTTVIGYAETEEEFSETVNAFRDELREYHELYDIYNDYDDDDDYYDDDYEDEYYESDDENSDYDHTDPDDRTKKKKRRKNSKIPLAAPIRKGGRILSNISASLIRSLTALLILAVMIFASWTFLRASAPYGDIMEAVNTKTVPLSLAAYLSVALIFLLSEFIALLWSMTKVRVRDQWGVHKEDTGRGLNSFLLVFLTSYAAFWINRFLPETPDIIYGLKGGLEVYGSMHNVLFGLCAAGIISCLIRKYL